MNDIMVDLETLGTSADSVILSIGAVYFSEEGLGNEFYKVIDLKSSLFYKRKIDADTIKWWMCQEKVPRKELFNNDYDEDIIVVLYDFSSFIKDDFNVRIWGNGAAFDNKLLADTYVACGMEVPWKFWNDRCYRTIKSIYRDVPLPARTGVYHHALDDAKYQAQHLVEICKAHDIELM